ncbi:MAG: C1 family peptidase [Planctomycetota bacterium]
MQNQKKKPKKRNVKAAKNDEFFALTPQAVASMKNEFESNSTYKMLQNAVTRVTVENLVKRHEVVFGADPSYSIMLDDWSVTNQKSSGRCWLFAALNLLRVGAMKKLKLNNFEFSQNHIMFWDKFEKANYFLEAIIETANLGTDDRTVAFLLGNIISDGGQWNMFVNIVKKYGVVPKAAMPETESSSSTGSMNGILTAKLRESAMTLRNMYNKGESIEKLRLFKKQILSIIYRILSIHLGTPPDKFTWQWRDKKNKFHRLENLTPKSFAQKFITIPLDEYVCLVHDPRKSNPYSKLYTVKYLGNVVGGEIVTYLNIDIELIKKTAMKTLQSGEPVWFGCDVGKQMEREKGIWDAKLNDYESIYNTTLTLNKEERLLYGATRMTHAMLFTGIDIVKGKPRRWRVENSWGDTNGQKGFYLMNDSWFSEHMFEIAARKKYLPEKLKKSLKMKPIVLSPWDPMGSLAF